MDYMPLSLIILGLCLSWWLLRPIILYYLAVSKRANNNKSSSTAGKLPPGPRPLPVIGNILELGSLPHMSLTKLARVYGPIIRLKLGHITTIVVSSAPMAREILQTHDDSFANRMPPDAITPFRHDELGVAWVTISPLWRNLRRICNVHLFARRTLDSNQHLRRQKIQKLLAQVSKSCETGNPVDIGEAAFIAALNLLGNTIFSMDLTMDAASELSVKELKELVCNVMVEVGRPNMADYFPVLKRVDPQGVKRRMTDCFQRTFDLFDRIIGERLRVRSSAVSGASSYNRRKVNDMLDILLDLAEDKGEEGGIDLYTVKHLFFDLFIAGSDTTASTFEWAMAELLRNPDKLTKAQAELEQVMGGRCKVVEESDLARLPYLQATVKETFRMHPAIPLLLPRRAGSTKEVGGYTVPEGAQVLVNVWAIGRDPAVWKDPDEFIPERFVGSEMDVRGLNFEVLPFGGGRRICPGLPLAVRMLHLMLGSRLNCFDWKLEDGVSPETMEMGDVFGITLRRAQPLRAIPLPRKTTWNMDQKSLHVGYVSTRRHMLSCTL